MENAIKKYPELDEIVGKIADDACREINQRIKNIESEMPYRAQYVLEAVVRELQRRI